MSFLYREIGAMVRSNHPTLYDDSRLGESSFPANRKERAREIYCNSLAISNPDMIADLYWQETGLTLAQVYEVFDKGDWLLGRHQYSYGGPKWAAIAGADLTPDLCTTC